jgi:hypothetical protein
MKAAVGSCHPTAIQPVRARGQRFLQQPGTGCNRTTVCSGERPNADGGVVCVGRTG